MFILILQIVAVILLFLAAIGVTAPRVNLGWLGLFLWFLAELLPRIV